MLKRLFSVFEPFVLSLLGTVLLATLFPARGSFAVFAGYMADAGIILLFFLHGAKLSREAIWQGVRNWPLHGGVGGNVRSVSDARAGPVATARCRPVYGGRHPLSDSATVDRPVVHRVHGDRTGQCRGGYLQRVLFEPARHRGDAGFRCGADAGERQRRHIARIGRRDRAAIARAVRHRPFATSPIGDLVGRHKAMLTLVDRGSILLVVYTAFGAAVVEGLWTRVSPGDLGRLLLICLLLLGVVLMLTLGIARLMRLPRADAIVLQFCGSKKSGFGRADGGRPVPGGAGRRHPVARHALPPDPVDRLRYARASL